MDIESSENSILLFRAPRLLASLYGQIFFWREMYYNYAGALGGLDCDDTSRIKI